MPQDKPFSLDDIDLNITDTTRIAPGPTPNAAPAPPRALLRVTNSPDSTKVSATFALRTDDVRVGRASWNTIAINDDEISREHIALVWRQGRYMLSDLNTANGTLVRGEAIKAECLLTFGDEIVIGSTSLRYERP